MRKNDWIPIDVRLPDDGEEVLVTYIVKGKPNKRYVMMAEHVFDGWSDPFREYRIPGVCIQVLAWMPLPDPYRK